MAKTKSAKPADKALGFYRLRVRDRILTGVVGGAMITPAVVALLHGYDGSAVLGFTAFGGVGLLLAAIGTLPARAVIGRGKNAITLELAVALDAVFEALPLQALGQVASQLALEGSNDEDGVSAVAMHVNQQFFLETEMTELIQKVAQQSGAVVEREVDDGDGSRWDLRVTHGHFSVVVEIKATIDVRTVRRLKNRIGDKDLTLLLVGSNISTKAEALLTTFPRPVVVLHSADRAALENELRTIFENMAK